MLGLHSIGMNKHFSKLSMAVAAASVYGLTWAQAVMPAPSGYWRLVEDNVVLEFVACPGDATAVCAVVRGVPPPDPKEDQPPKCGEMIGLDFKPDSGGQRWAGKVRDHVEAKSYRARLQPGKNGSMDLVIIAMGGLYTEALPMVQVRDFTPCTTGR
jgi:hypothetical protein